MVNDSGPAKAVIDAMADAVEATLYGTVTRSAIEATEEMLKVLATTTTVLAIDAANAAGDLTLPAKAKE